MSGKEQDIHWRVRWLIKMKSKKIRNCGHLDQIKKVKPNAKGCFDCLKTGDEWVHLRICLTCGNVGCCNDSKNKHATKHFLKTNHPVIKSFEPGEDWVFCYLDDLFIE